MLVFQYGSNTSIQRLNSDERLQGTARVVGLARTVDCFELVFAYFSPSNGCAAAHLQPGGSRHAYGVLYDIPSARVLRNAGQRHRTLDDIEEEGRAYDRTTIQVRLASQGSPEVEATTYLVRNPQPHLKTGTAYVRHIISGLRDQGAPADYLAYVREQAIASNPAIAPGVRAL